MQWQPAPPPAIRPLSLGEIIDGGFQIFKRNLVPLIKITAIFVVPVNVFSLLINLSILPERRTIDLGFGRTFTGYSQQHSGAAIFGATMLVLALTFVLRSLAAGAITRLVSQDYFGQTADAQGSLKFAMARFGALIGASILMILGLVAGFVACIIPGIFLAVAWSVVTPALVIENLSPGQALGRSLALVKPRWWPTLGYSFVIGLIVAIPGFMVVIPTAIIANTSTASGVITSAVLNTVVQLFTTPFAAATIVLLYFDLRVRGEGFDLQVMASALDMPAPPAASQPYPTTDGVPGGYQAPPQPPPPPAWGAPDVPPPPPAWGSPDVPPPPPDTPQ